MEAEERIIVALDVDNLDRALEFVEELYPYVGYFKVGLELLTSEGAPKVTEAIHRRGGKIFYDGKFKDIPNTVAGASRAVSKLGVEMFNVHASGGMEMMKAAVDNKGDSTVLAVTVLTSLSEEQVSRIYGASVKDKVAFLSKCAKDAGMDGLICSPQELQFLRANHNFDGLLLVTPGVRPAWATVGDQKRIMTPGEAIKAGADYLVIGRPITKPPSDIGNSVDAAKMIADDIRKVII